MFCCFDSLIYSIFREFFWFLDQELELFLILEFSKEDMSKSLLHMISNDIGQLACLYAKLHNLSRVYFGGFFIRGHPVTMHTITYSINFFTKVRFIHPVMEKSLFCSGTDAYEFSI